MEKGEAIKSTTFIVAQASVDCHKNVVMADMLDRSHNRLYFHKTTDGEFIFDAYYLNDRLKGETQAELRNIFDVLALLKEHGVSIIYSAENEGTTTT